MKSKHLNIVIIPFLILFSTKSYSEEIKVGIILPLTGPLAEYGVASKNGIELAKKDNPSLFSKIHFLYEDSQYDPKLAMSAYRKLREDSSVKIIYNWGSNPSAPLIPIAEREAFPLFAADFSSNAFKNISNVVAFAPTSKLLGKKLSENLKNSKYKKLAILSVENLYINGIIDGLKESLGEDQSIVYHDAVLATDNDFSSYITKLKTKDFDALGIMLYAGQIQNFYKKLKAANITKPTFGSDFMESRAEISASGDFIKGAVYPHLKISSEFYSKYMKEYNDDSQVTYSGTAYDFAMMISELHKKDNSFYTKHLELVKTLNKYQGVMGKYVYEESKEYGKRLYSPVYIKRIKDGFYEVVD